MVKLLFSLLLALVSSLNSSNEALLRGIMSAVAAGKVNDLNQNRNTYTRGERTSELNKLRSQLLTIKQGLDKMTKTPVQYNTNRYARFYKFHNKNWTENAFVKFITNNNCSLNFLNSPFSMIDTIKLLRNIMLWTKYWFLVFIRNYSLHQYYNYIFQLYVVV